MIVIGSVAVITPYLIQDISAWTLTIKLTDKPFGDDRAWIEVRGPDGYEAGSWYDWASIKTGASTASVSIYMSESDFPSGEQYQVCVSSKALFSLVPNCARGIHGSGDETIRMSLE